MNSKGHLYISVAKSIIRTITCCIAGITKNIQVMALGFLIAEILGVIEELVDKR